MVVVVKQATGDAAAAAKRAAIIEEVAEAVTLVNETEMKPVRMA